MKRIADWIEREGLWENQPTDSIALRHGAFVPSWFYGPDYYLKPLAEQGRHLGYTDWLYPP